MLKRAAGLRRTGGPKRQKPIATVNRKRRKSEFARCFGSKERVAFVRSLPCVACQWSNAVQMTRSQNAHTVIPGKGIKGDYDTIAPLCNAHHRLYDAYAGVFAVPDVRDAIKREAGRVEDEWRLVSGE